jgi:SP family arabinose:H+ symporter-like MFS transporter
MKSKEKVGYVFFLAIVAAFGGFLFGYDTAVISGTISKVGDLFHLDSIQQGWLGSSAIIGSIAGALCAGFISDYFGRKKTMLIAAILFIVSGFGCALSGSFSQLIIWRIVGGIGIGVVSVVSPIYISEIAITKFRGLLVAFYQLAITIGILSSYYINYLLENFSLTGHLTNTLMNQLFVTDVWRSMLGMESLPAILFLIVVFFIPESPRWMIIKNHIEGASRIFGRIYGNKEDADKQILDTQSTLSKETKSDFSVIWQPGIRKAVIIGVCIAILGQFMGVNAVIYYGPEMFKSAHLSGGDSMYAQVLVGLVNMLTTVLAMLIIDRIGRKKLIYFGVSGMIISLILIVFYYLTGAQNYSIVVYFMLYIFFQAASISAVVFVLLSEMYPTRVRGVAMSIASFALWVANFIIVLLTPVLFQVISPAGLFIIFAVMCLPYMYIMWKMVPETAGMSLEDIERYWTKNK